MKVPRRIRSSSLMPLPLAFLAWLAASCAWAGGAHATSTPPPTVGTQISVGDGGLIGPSECERPCLWGLLPGTSTEDDLNDALAEWGYLDSCTPIAETPSWGRALACGPDLGFSFDSGGSTIATISFVPDAPIELSAIVAALGGPSEVIVLLVGTPDHPLVAARLLFGESATIIWLAQEDGIEYPINPDTVAQNVIYASQSAFEEIRGSLRAHSSSWAGFGVYSDPNPLMLQ